MYKILTKQNLTPTVKRFDIVADDLVATIKPGQFMAIMPERASRFIPMSVYDVDHRRRCVSLVFEEKDADTLKLGALKINDMVFAIQGPFGQGVSVENKGVIVCVGEDLKLTSLCGLCRSFKQVGNKVLGIAGFKSRKHSMLENQMRLNSTNFFVMYKDGMHDRKGDILGPLEKVLRYGPVNHVYVDVSLEKLGDVVRMLKGEGVPFDVNVMDVLAANPSFFSSVKMNINGKDYFPADQGCFVDGTSLDVPSYVNHVQALREYVACRKHESESLAQKDVFARLKKFVWG